MRRLALLLLVAPALACAPASETESVPPPAFERIVEVPAAGLVAVPLDRHVYEAARADLGDLRIRDRHGDAVPYLLDDGRGPTHPEKRPRMRNRGHQPDRSATVVLDFGERFEKDRLVLRTSGRNFRRRVTVEGGDDGETWTTLVDDAWVFAVPETVHVEDVPLPVNDLPLLRVTVQPGGRERMRVEILEAWVPAGGRGPRHEDTLSPRWSRAAAARPGETWLTLDLGARHQPFEAVVLEVEDERFFREVRSEVRRDIGPVPRDQRAVALPPQWDPLGQGAVYRLDGERERLRLDVRGRARVVRVRVLNGDDRPLVFERVTVQVPVERLLFEAEREGEYRLTYGAVGLEAPEYDLARTLDTAAEAPRAELGPPVRLAIEADVLPWTERHPALLWGGLLVVVAALGALTWRALRSV